MEVTVDLTWLITSFIVVFWVAAFIGALGMHVYNRYVMKWW